MKYTLQGPPRPYNRRHFLDWGWAYPGPYGLPGDGEECLECPHPLGEHTSHGHCMDECSCALQDRRVCPCENCAEFRAAGREWQAAKAHNREDCPCGVCSWVRDRALERL